MNIFKRFQLATLFLFCISHSYSQEAGRSFIRNYPPPEYRASQQNWAVTQDSRGIMYFGNNDGLLEFDGISWNLTKLPIVRTVAIDSSGCIYVGLENDMGYLKPDMTGKYQYYSPKEKIPGINRDLSQSSVLPKTDQLDSALGEHFILHKP